MSYVDVLLPLPLSKCRYTYREPENTPDIAVGSLVSVPWGQGKVYTGVVLSKHETAPDPSLRYKSVLTLLPYPSLPLSLLRLITWAADYYMCGEGEVLKSVVPAAFRPDGEAKYRRIEEVGSDPTLALLDELPSLFSWKDVRTRLPREALPHFGRWLQEGSVQLSTDSDVITRPQLVKGWVPHRARLSDKSYIASLQEELRRSPSASRLLARLVEEREQLSPPVPLQELATRYDVSLSVINKLRCADLFILMQTPVEMEVPPIYQIDLHDRLSDHLRPLLVGEKPRPIVAHMEHSLLSERLPYTLMAEHFNAGHQVLLLLPNLSYLQLLTPLLLDHIPSEELLPYHSNVTPTQRNKSWYAALTGRRGIYIGLRAAAWLPLQAHTLTVVVDEEHPNYKQTDPAPRFHALQVALMHANFHAAPLVMTTPAPSVERSLLAIDLRYTLLSLPPAVRSFPSVTWVDLSANFKKNKVMGRLLSFELLDAINTTLSERGKVVLLLQRRGYARQVQCTSCATPLSCPNCKVTYRYYAQSERVVCPLCGRHEPLPKHCPSCGSAELVLMGTGIERLEEEVKQIYPTAPITLCSDIEPPLSLLASASLIAYVQVDLLSSLPDFRANERLYQLLSRHCSLPNVRRIVVQALQPQHNALEAFRQKSYQQMLDHELQERLLVGFPPLARMVDLYAEHPERHTALEIISRMEHLCRTLEGVTVLGPAPLPAHKKDVEVGYKLSLLFPLTLPVARLKQRLREWSNEIVATAPSTLRLYFDVDPIY